MEGQRGRSGSGIYGSLVGALATAQLRRLQFGWAVSTVGGRGDFYGEVAVLDWGSGYGYVRTATVVAATDLRLLVLGPARLEALIRACPALGEKLQAAVRERMRRI